MEKRLKYILGFFIFGIGLFFNNCIYAFGTVTQSSVYIDMVTLPLFSSNYQSSSSYLYTFNDYSICDGPGCNRTSSNLGYSIYKNGSSINPYFPKGQIQDGGAQINNYPLNNSAVEYEEYTGYCTDVLLNGRGWCYYGNVTPASGVFPIKVSLGLGSEFGKAFVYAGNLVNSAGTITPHYGLGSSYFSQIFDGITTYNTKMDSSMNYFRFFYDQNVNLSSPVDGFNLITLTGTNTGLVAWENFGVNNVAYGTKYSNSVQYIIDYGREGKKGLNFGGYGMGYSFALDLRAEEGGGFQRGNRTFSNIGSRCIEGAMKLGITNFDTLTSNNCSSLGLLVLKGDSYVTRDQNASVVVLGKNPNNTKQILYEQFDCADDDILRLMDLGTGTSCVSLSHGYIIHNGSGEVLPFSNKMDEYYIGDGNDFIDFFFNNGLFGYVQITDSQYCLKSSSSEYCFGLHATPQLSSLKELYLQAGGDLAGNGQTVTGNLIADLIINQPSSYYTYSGLVEYTMDGDFYVDEDTSYIDNYTDYTFINGVPQLKNLKFGVCPFKTNSDFATFGLKDFSFDLFVPHKCILAGIQAGYTSVNMSGYDYLNLPLKFIDSRLNNDNVLLVGHFVAILLIFGISSLLFYFLKFFK